MNDLISRKSVLEIIENNYGDIAEVHMGVLNLPPAQQWIPCSEKMPVQPNNNPEFDNKPLELYLVTVKNADYPFRAFWNGKIFTDGFGKVDAIAWMPLPEPYKADMRKKV